MIARDTAALEADAFDLVVVGGGVHGAALALEAARRGLRVALLERDDFGGASSGSSLRILHGGLRYLQTLDLPRFFASVAARRWFARCFPALVQPLPCLMPLYGGVKQPAVLRLALAANDLLSAARNSGVHAAARLPRGRVLTRAETLARFPTAPQRGLLGGALWHDHQMLSSERILIEMLRWAARLGAVVRNGVEVVRYVQASGCFAGVVARDQRSGRELVVRAQRIVNAAGAASSELAQRAGCADARFAPPSLAFNVLFEGDALGDCAMAVAAPGAALRFLCPSRYGVWAGTVHAARARAADAREPSAAEVADFVAELARAVPDFDWSRARIRRVYAGFLPVRRELTTELAVRPERVALGGPQSGLHAVVGIKFTTAGLEAADVLRRVYAGPLPALSQAALDAPTLSSATPILIDGDRAAALERGQLLQLVRETAEQEGALDADDFVLRRTNWTFTARDPALLRQRVEQALGSAAAERPAGRSAGLC